MEVLIFIFYLLLFGYAIISAPFFKSSGIGRYRLLLLFILKILAGFAYAWFYKLPKYAAGADTWRFYKLSLREKEWLLSDPVAFVKDLFVHGYQKRGSLFAGENSYWNDLKSNIPVKLLACINVLTNNSYYTAIIFFNFLFLFGLVGIYRVFNQIFPGKKWLLVLGIFLLPSTLFWCSGIHKDGLILSATGLVFYNFYKSLTKEYKKMMSPAIATIICLIFIFALRNYIALALLPALLCWELSERYPKHKLLIFSGVYLLCFVFFFGAGYIFPSLDFPQYIVKKQSEFLQLQGGSSIHPQPLHPDLRSFVAFFPGAFDAAFLQPHITQIANPAYLPAALEILFFIVVTFLFVIFLKPKFTSPVLFCLFFSISVLLITGYTITFIGAIVRYRSILFPLLITPLLCMTDFSRFKKTTIKLPFTLNKIITCSKKCCFTLLYL